MDIQAEGQTLDPETLLALHAKKTGALLRASLRVGALAGGADEAALAALTRYGERLGLAFQIVDDILDIEGNSAEMGKTAGSDLRKKKATYPAVFGLETARGDAARLLREATESWLRWPSTLGSGARSSRAERRGIACTWRRSIHRPISRSLTDRSCPRWRRRFAS